MPTSLFSEMDRGANGGGTASLEDQRALQLALELSMLGLEGTPGCPGTGTGTGTGTANDPDPLQTTPAGVFEEARSKKSQNMTECVPVPSSEHVAEIVGRQGCKIKALRAKTNTYIKTPVRGEEPVFVVTGRKEDVARAKREILSAAEHFSQIRASRKSSLGALLGAPPGPPASVPGHVTIQVRVPYRVVGLVVGPKGATIKRIQHQTHTYIVTPSRDKEPVFEVTGLPESVEAARREIEAHIALRTGTGPSLDDSELLSVLCRGGLGSILGCLDPPGSNGSNGSNGAFSSSGSCSSSSSSSGAPGLNDIVAIWGAGVERDESLGESPSFESASSIWSFPGVALPSRSSPPASIPTSPTDSLLGRRECVVCGDKEVTAALVPCGHNHFCLDCSNRVCESSDPSCPVCSRPVLQALRIFS
ncbi:RNA-binding protein MEX3B-like [Osmia lignaria lignaria]|uniref:RNA-binding protein MEX3B-like n=1 Tax=Osmia lignaria lignaria TaxID=1437193 RepID=UPI0010F98114|nr:RNA-binding protein MEX3B isoform X1 [Osmia bicornis bicornis]XP_034196151.1 RNA-binding protein MEX3B isoform X2 [Osmia lignaria]XP_034196152.1 RNA-binding protein MEX3B isoform X2 [Osmia lignaria]